MISSGRPSGGGSGVSSVPVVRTRSTDLDVDRTARIISGGASLLESPDLGMRQGQVVAVSAANISAQTCDITLGGDPTVIPGVKHNSNYRPTVGDVIWVFSLGNDLLVFDRVGAFGPSMISTAATASVITSQTRSSTAWGNLATAGPAITVSVSPSGRLLVGVSSWQLYNTNNGNNEGGALIGIELSGANVQAPDNLEVQFGYTGISWTLPEGSNVDVFDAHCASKVTLMTGLNSGSTTITTRYRSYSGSSVTFEHRQLWAVPL